MDDRHSHDEELVSRAATGDEDALTTLLRRHGPALRRAGNGWQPGIT